MKIKANTIRSAFWIILGVTILFTSLALTRTRPEVQDATATPVTQKGTVVATADVQGGAGSTDGIVVVAAVIVMIVIIPILLRRQVWTNGRRKRS